MSLYKQTGGVTSPEPRLPPAAEESVEGFVRDRLPAGESSGANLAQRRVEQVRSPKAFCAL